MSDNMTLLPTNAFGNASWGDAGAAAIGAFVGSWFGNGFGGWGNRGVATGVGDAALAAGVGTNLVMDNLNQIQNGVNNLGLNLTQGQCQIQQSIGQSSAGIQNALCQGFSGVVENANRNAAVTGNTLGQGFAGINAAINQTSASTNNYLAQGFSGLNSAIRDNGYETRLAVQDLSRQNAECCCATQKTIQAEGAATRQLIQNNLITELQTQLCDAKNKISTLENQQFTAANNAAQTQQIVNTVLLHLRANSTTGTATA